MSDSGEFVNSNPVQEVRAHGRFFFIAIAAIVLLVVISLSALLAFGMFFSKPVLTESPQVRDPGYWFEFSKPFAGNLFETDSNLIYTADIKLEIFPNEGFSEKEALEEMGVDTDNPRNKMALIEQIIVDILDSQSLSNIKSAYQKEKIRNTIKNQINAILEKGMITDVTMRLLVT